MPRVPIKGRFGNQLKARQLVSTESGFTPRRSGSRAHTQKHHTVQHYIPAEREKTP